MTEETETKKELSDEQFGTKWNQLAALKRQVDDLEKEIAPYILKKDDFLKFGGLVAKINRGKGKYGYEEAFKKLMKETTDIEQAKKLKALMTSHTSVSYTEKLCTEAGIKKEDIPFTGSTKEPTVTFELVEK